MIFNFGENPTLDVLRMLMHYTVVQQEQQKTQGKRNVVPSPPTISKPSSRTTLKSIVVSAGNNTDTSSSDGPRRLHVTNLPFKVKDHELRTMFEAYGTVLDAEIIYNERGSKGFGFVTMETMEAANKAKNALNRKEIDGRKIEVNNATPRSTQNKVVSRLQARTTDLQSAPCSQVNDIIRSTQVTQVPAFPGNWSPTGITGFTTSPVRSNQISMTLPPIAVAAPAPPPINLAAAATTTSLPGFACFPTPEEYAQYYNYISSHGPFRGGYQNIGGSFTNYRYQPY